MISEIVIRLICVEKLPFLQPRLLGKIGFAKFTEFFPQFVLNFSKGGIGDDLQDGIKEAERPATQVGDADFHERGREHNCSEPWLLCGADIPSCCGRRFALSTPLFLGPLPRGAFPTATAFVNEGYTPWNPNCFGCRVNHFESEIAAFVSGATILNQTNLPPMNDLAFIILPVAAAGYSFIYLLFGGGLGGAVVIFFIAKLLGK